MELYLAVRGSHETQPRLFPLDRGRTWQAGRYMGPLDNGRYIRDQEGPLDAIPEYIPLEPNTCINRFHFEVGCDETGPWVRDLRSANGTSRNGVRLPPHHKHSLRPYDQLQVGRCMMVVVGKVRIDPLWHTWNDGTVVNLAGSIDEQRTFDLLPILADALEEAGCDNADLLGHLRQPAAYLGSSFILDALLGRT